MELDQSYWNDRYQNQQTGWDVGAISTPLKAYIDQLTNKDIAILIPGCGNAHEAVYLLQQGFTNVTLVDIAPVAVNAIQLKLKEFDARHLHIICGDFFELEQTFDLIIEQTFFCALRPSLRNAYAEKMVHLLKQDGKLVGLLFNRHFEGGPPFGGNKAAYLSIFEPKFEVIKMEECYNSIAPRVGSELFFFLQKK